MKKHKFYWGILAVVMMVAMLGVVVTACGDDDDDSGSGIVGTWVGSDSESDTYGSWEETVSFTFQSNGIGIIVTSWRETYNGKTTSGTDNATFTYTKESAQSGKIIVQEEDASVSWTSTYRYEISGKSMKIIWQNDYSYYSGITSGDGEEIEYILTKQ